MKAIRVPAPGGPEVLRYEDVPEPAPKPGEAVVKLEAIGVNFIDVYFRAGLYPAQMPITLGQEGAGTVTAVGTGVSDLNVGDRVAYTGVPGSYAQYAAVPTQRLIRVPEGVSTRDAAAVMLQGMTAHYLTHSTYALKNGDTCLLHAAAGGVGLLLTQIARSKGARVLGTVSTDYKAQLAREAGAEPILYSRDDFETEVKRLTNNAGVQVVYDSVGKTTFAKGLNCLKARGMMVLFGLSSGPVGSIDPQILNQKGSLFLTRPSLQYYTASREELVQRASELFGWLRSGQLRLRIGAEFPLSQAAEAHRQLEARKTTGKVLLRPDGA